MTVTTHREAMPSPALADAFLRALMRLVGRRGDRQQVTLPSGNVDVDEQHKVIIALLHARADSRLHANHGALEGVDDE
jgi:hypothetical protein